MPVSFGDAGALLRELVTIDSRNPTLVPGAPGEGTVARALGEVLRAWGMAVDLYDVAPGRPNVVARVGGSDGRCGRSLILNGHLDVVGTDGMVHAPFAAVARAGCVYGRGAADMKGGIAAMCAAAARASREHLAGEVIVAAVIDEEYESLGTRALLGRGMRADAAIVAEPTRLAIMPAHRGFVWLEITVHGRAAHGSRYEIGVDAIRGAALVMAELDALEYGVLQTRVHNLLGRASLHASQIEGGVGWSTYPERCVLRVERRTIPGETAQGVVAEVEAAVARVAARRPDLRAAVTLVTAQSPSDVAPSAPIVAALERCVSEAGEPARLEGMSAWTDAAIFNDAGIPAVCFGPGDIALAHSAEEWVRLSEVERAADVLARLVPAWCGAGAG